MGSHQWSHAGRHPSQDILEHLEHLKAEFNNVLNTLETSSSRAGNLSSHLRDNIQKAITNGTAEVEGKGQCSKW